MVIHDADNTVSPNELNFFLNTLVEKNQNLVIGTRFVYPMEEGAMKKSNYLVIYCFPTFIL